MKVIIVEDEPITARGIAKLLTIICPEAEVIDICFNGKDGAESILKKRPDLIFTDIRMPVMGGLEMIKSIHEKNYYPHFVILTVYAEFDYAKTAMHLGVKDYLLKPISMDSLKEIISSCKNQIEKKNRLLQENYLKKAIFLYTPEYPDRNPFLSYTCTFMILFSGSVCNNIYNENILRTQIQPINYTTLHTIEERYHISLIALSGHHFNECIYAVISPSSNNVDLKAISHDLFTLHSGKDTILNLVISDTSLDGKELFSIRQNAYLYALFHIRFGCSSILFCLPDTNKNIDSSSDIKQLCSNLSEFIKKQKISDCVRSMIINWRRSNTSQFQLITDLRYFINALKQTQPTNNNHSISNADEIVCSCQTYEELEKEINREIEQFLGYQDDFIVRDQHTIAQQVKEWLDENFTTQITYKIFQDLFNLNEKYISTLFKAEYNITPSKYVGELRLNMAKKLMQTNPEIRMKDVAELVGFTDAFYFSRVFKAHEGITPSQYIKNKCDK